MKGTKGRPGDVACYRCGRPLTLAQAWKLKVTKNGRPFTNYFCAEHVVIFNGGNSWRPLEPGEQPPELVMGEPTPAAPDVDQPEVEPMKPIGGIAWEDIEKVKTDPDAPRFEDEWQQLPVERPPDDDFDPFNDVGF